MKNTTEIKKLYLKKVVNLFQSELSTYYLDTETSEKWIVL